jgi:Uma2 family endonuclease
MARLYERSNKKREGYMTITEYFQTPETVLPQELAFGQLRVADSPSVSHQRVVRELVMALTPFVQDRKLGELLFAPMDVVLDFEADLVVQPDLLFVAKERAHIVTAKVYGVPDLVIEVLSPHPRIGKLSERLDWFSRYGVRECWLARLPEKQISVLTLTKQGVVAEQAFSRAERVRSDVLEGLDLTPLQIFGW